MKRKILIMGLMLALMLGMAINQPTVSYAQSVPDLVLTITPSTNVTTPAPTPFQVGVTGTYTLELRNIGTAASAAAAGEQEVTGTLPNGITLAAPVSVPLNWAC